MKAIYVIALFSFCFAIPVVSQDKKEEKKKTIESLVKDLSSDDGVIPVYYNDENKLYFEIKPEVLSKDVLMVTRLAALPSGYSAYG